MTRAEAKAAGLPRYHGRPCQIHGTTERYTANCECCACACVRTAKDHQKHLAKRRAVKAAYRVEHREEARDRSAKWSAENPDWARERVAIWHRENRDKSCAKRAKRRAALVNRTPVWADLKIIAEIYAEAQRLTETTGVPHHVDHIIPLHGKTVSGLHVEGNLQILTAQENLRKSNRVV
jgi:hypothetical protein